MERAAINRLLYCKSIILAPVNRRVGLEPFQNFITRRLTEAETNRYSVVRRGLRGGPPVKVTNFRRKLEIA